MTIAEQLVNTTNEYYRSNPTPNILGIINNSRKAASLGKYSITIDSNISLSDDEKTYLKQEHFRIESGKTFEGNKITVISWKCANGIGV